MYNEGKLMLVVLQVTNISCKGVVIVDFLNDIESVLLIMLVGLLGFCLYLFKKYKYFNMVEFYLSLGKAFCSLMLLVFFVTYEWANNWLQLVRILVLALVGLEFISNVIKAVCLYPCRLEKQKL